MMPWVLVLSLALVPTPSQLDKAGRDAFAALRDFQVEELRAYNAQAKWPMIDVHREITAKLAVARDCIDDSLVYGFALTEGHPVPAQVISMLRSEQSAVAALNGLVGPLASKKARDLMNKVQDKFAVLLNLFPVTAQELEPDHPPKP